MTSEGHEFGDAVEIVKILVKVAQNPAVLASLQRLHETAKKAAVAEALADQHPEKEARNGTCPTCGNSYTLKKNGALRRHGKGTKCYTEDQLPAEIIPAVLAIARMGDGEPEAFQNDDSS